MITTTLFVFFTLATGNNTVAFRATEMISMATPADGKGCAVLLDGQDLDTYLKASCSEVTTALNKN